MTPRILVADDSITIQKVVELTFSKEDFQIIKALNGVEAIAKAKEEKPDLILLDVVMPEKNGLEVSEYLREDAQFKDVPIILLVGAFEVFDKERVSTVGADDFVTKPFESKVLIAKVKQHLFAKAARKAEEAEKAKPKAPPAEPILLPSPETLTVPPPPAPSVETAIPVAPSLLDMEQVPIVVESIGEPIPEKKEAEEAALELKSEILTSSIAEGTKFTPTPTKTEEAEVSDEELWQLLDLGGPSVLPLAPSREIEKGPELALVAEDSPEAFFDLYFKAPPLEEVLSAPLPEKTTEEAEAFSLPTLEEPPSIPAPEPDLLEPFSLPSSEEGMAEIQEKAEEEIISFDNLGEAVLEEGMKKEAIPTERDELAREEPAELVGSPVELEEVSAGEETVDLGERTEIREEKEMPPAELAESIADRIVKEVTDRIISRLEKIIWEVVPDLAEALITKEIEKIKAAAEEQENP